MPTIVFLFDWLCFQNESPDRSHLPFFTPHHGVCNFCHFGWWSTGLNYKIESYEVGVLWILGL